AVRRRRHQHPVGACPRGDRAGPGYRCGDPCRDAGHEGRVPDRPSHHPRDRRAGRQGRAAPVCDEGNVMAEYLGQLGQLVELGCASTERVQSGPRYFPQVTVEGRRSVQLLPAPPRAWAVNWRAARREEVAALADFVTGGWGPGPWHWVSL